jgi:plasmid stabilization system protein ParE
MPRPVKVLDDAIAEARAAFQWYQERSDTAAARFRDELDRAVEKIGKSPESWPEYVHDTRRYLLRRFPYFVVYQITSAEILILAIAHARRRPGYWMDR